MANISKSDVETYNTSHLVRIIATNTGKTVEDVHAVIKEYERLVVDKLMLGYGVRLMNLGLFHPDFIAYEDYNLGTVKFSISKELRAKMRDTKARIKGAQQAEIRTIELD